MLAPVSCKRLAFTSFTALVLVCGSTPYGVGEDQPVETEIRFIQDSALDDYIRWPRGISAVVVTEQSIKNVDFIATPLHEFLSQIQQAGNSRFEFATTPVNSLNLHRAVSVGDNLARPANVLIRISAFALYIENPERTFHGGDEYRVTLEILPSPERPTLDDTLTEDTYRVRNAFSYLYPTGKIPTFAELPGYSYVLYRTTPRHLISCNTFVVRDENREAINAIIDLSVYEVWSIVPQGGVAPGWSVPKHAVTLALRESALKCIYNSVSALFGFTIAEGTPIDRMREVSLRKVEGELAK